MKQNKGFYLVWGSIFIIIMAMNTISCCLFDHQGSLFFNAKWWSSWFPIYIVLFAFLAMPGTHNDNNDS